MNRMTDPRVRDDRVANTTPYAWPWNGSLDARATAVLVVAAPGLARDTPELTNAALLLEALGSVGSPSIRVGTRTRFAPLEGGEAGAVPTDIQIEASGVDGFFGSPLETRLRQLGVERLLLCGGWLETSVHSTMRTANDMGFECLLVRDACIPLDETIVERSISMIEMSGGIFGAVGLTSDVLRAYSSSSQKRDHS